MSYYAIFVSFLDKKCKKKEMHNRLIRMSRSNMMQTQTVSAGIPLHCPNTECRYKWRYTGRLFIYATCPCCRKNVRISQNRVDLPQTPQVRGPEAEAVNAPGTERQ